VFDARRAGCPAASPRWSWFGCESDFCPARPQPAEIRRTLKRGERQHRKARPNGTRTDRALAIDPHHCSEGLSGHERAAFIEYPADSRTLFLPIETVIAAPG
jgi:hypothetical protein